MSIVDNTLMDIKDNIKVVTLPELGVDRLLHISTNPNIAKFTPTVPPRATDQQDHRLPRICTSTCLAGCIIGYNGLSYDFLDRTWEDREFLGGYVIYSFKPEIAVTPDTSLLGDQEVTDEQWIVSYNPETTHYVPAIIGKMFLSEYKSHRHQIDTTDMDPKPDTDWRVQYTYVMYVEVNASETVQWNREFTLQPGYHRITTIDIMSSHSCHELPSYKIESVDRITYMEAKQLTAGLLANDSPASLGWGDSNSGAVKVSLESYGPYPWMEEYIKLKRVFIYSGIPASEVKRLEAELNIKLNSEVFKFLVNYGNLKLKFDTSRRSMSIDKMIRETKRMRSYIDDMPHDFARIARPDIFCFLVNADEFACLSKDGKIALVDHKGAVDYYSMKDYIDKRL